MSGAETARRSEAGGVEHISLDTSAVEALYFDGKQEIDGEYLYDRSWGYAPLSAVSDRLQARYEKSGKSPLYEAIKGCLTGDGTYKAAAELAAELGISAEALRGAVFRLRRQFRECVTEEIAKTCESESEIQEEIAFLCRILAE